MTKREPTPAEVEAWLRAKTPVEAAEHAVANAQAKVEKEQAHLNASGIFALTL